MSAANVKKKKPMEEASVPSAATARLFKNGRSQAVRLPKEFRFNGNEVAIRRDSTTGEVVLAPARPPQAEGNQTSSAGSLNVPSQQANTDSTTPSNRKLSLQELFAIFDQADFPEDFFERRTSMPRELNLFE